MDLHLIGLARVFKKTYLDVTSSSLLGVMMVTWSVTLGD